MNAAVAPWKVLLARPASSDHIVQVYQDPGFLAEAVSQFIGSGLRRGEGALVIARPAHWEFFARQLRADGCDVSGALSVGQLAYLDAHTLLSKLMRNGIPDEKLFRETVGGAVEDMRRRFGGLRAFEEVVDLLWQDGSREAAILLEELWDDLAKVQPFSLLCAYFMDLLDDGSYGGPIESVCQVHSHLIPARRYDRFDEAVIQASQDVLDRSLANMLHSMASAHRPSTDMPLGQATIMWLKKNMPLTADKVLSRTRAYYAKSES